MVGGCLRFAIRGGDIGRDNKLKVADGFGCLCLSDESEGDGKPAEAVGRGRAGDVGIFGKFVTSPPIALLF